MEKYSFVGIVVLLFVVVYLMDLIVCKIYCRKKKIIDKQKKEQLNNYETAEFETAERNFLKTQVWKLKQLLNGWMMYRVKRLGKFPSQKYRVWMLKNIFGMEIADKVVMYSWDTIRAPWNITIGEGTVIGDGVILDGRNFITIGSNVNISTAASIYTEQHDINDPYFRSLNSGGSVVIGDRAWISSHTSVLPKVHVGEGAVLGAGAIATKDLEAYAICVGIPAKKVGERNKALKYEFDGSFLPFF